MCIHIHIYIYIYTYDRYIGDTCVYIYIYMSIHIHIHTYVHVYMYIYIYIWIDIALCMYTLCKLYYLCGLHDSMRASGEVGKGRRRGARGLRAILSQPLMNKDPLN